MTRRASDSAGSVLSFTFLDVLMCTMGSLLLLLVLFGVIMVKATRERREGETATISLDLLNAPSVPASPPRDAPDAVAAADDPDELARQLEQTRRELAAAEHQRREAAETRQREEARVTHLEDHERRLEHELGKLHFAMQALQAAEQKQTVDREQAAAEAKRLKELVRDTEAQLADMRKSNSTEKSYAIVPYKGANGTFRRPVFIECTAEAVTIQPEGIVFTVADFDGPLRSGNPLAAAIRAAHQELNGRAVAAGRADMPDPYPLIIVRPDGAGAYAYVLDAISSWESDYGYEFVEADWKLKYPEPDPRLAQIMNHAVSQARERQALLAKVAPRTYGPRFSSGGGVAGEASTGGAGSRFSDLAGGDGRLGAHSAKGSLGAGSGGNPLRGDGRNGGGNGGGTFSDEFAAQDGVAIASAAADETAGLGPGGRAGANPGGVPGTATTTAAGPRGVPSTQYGVLGGQGAASGTQHAATSKQESSSSNQNSASGSGAGTGDPHGAQSAARGGADGLVANGAAAGNSATNMASSGGAGASGATGGSGGHAAASSIVAGSPGLPSADKQGRRGSAADARSANWANAEAGRRASPITRPVKIEVTRDQLAVLDGDSAAAAAVVTFQQPVDGVLDELAAAVKRQVKDWGLAGDGMYWRPVLVVNVVPGAERQATRIAELLEGSGIDVRLPQAVAAVAEGAGHATR